MRTASAINIGLGFVLLCLNPNYAKAWEADVHFGLTKWLALKVGFPEPVASLIAEGDQSIDDSTFTDPVYVTRKSACFFGNDVVGAVTIHDNHFPSQKDPPNSPSGRVVVPGEVWQSGRMRPVPNVDGSEASFLALGRFLHAFQDSWSHQGEPDIPRFCRADLAWGHPKARGGWLCHDADRTYLWNKTDVPAVARATYEVLATVFGKSPLADWNSIETRVYDFGAGASLQAKHAWFRAEGIDDASFLGKLDLPNCDVNGSCDVKVFQTLVPNWSARVKDEWEATRTDAVIPDDVPNDIRAVFERFFQLLTAQNNDLAKLIDPAAVEKAYSEALEIPGNCPLLFDSSGRPTPLYLAMLGPGFVDGSGAHQFPEMCAQNTRAATGGAALSCPVLQAGAAQGEAKAQPRGPGLRAIQEFLQGTPPYAYSIAPGPEPDAYSALARFVHLPDDVLLVSAAKIDGRPKITRVLWAPKE
jgi:hypothetical protein